MREEEKSRLLDSLSEAVRNRGLSRKTESAYGNQVRRFINFNCAGNSLEIGVDKINPFLIYLTEVERVSAATRNQAASALLFFYREVLKIELQPELETLKRAPAGRRRIVVFTAEEARAILRQLSGAPLLVASLMYGAGLRLREALRLRVRDLNFERGEIAVRDWETGEKDRATLLPRAIVPALKKHLVKVKWQYEDDFCPEQQPCAAIKSPPRGKCRCAGFGRRWQWQYVFPSAKVFNDPAVRCRSHISESTVQKAFQEAMRKAGIEKSGACCYSLRHSFAAHLSAQRYDVRRIQNILGHKNLRTTAVYFNFSCGESKKIKSPLD